MAITGATTDKGTAPQVGRVVTRGWSEDWIAAVLGAVAIAGGMVLLH